MKPLRPQFALVLLFACTPQPSTEGGESAGPTRSTQDVEGPGGNSSRREPAKLVVSPPEPSGPLEPVSFELFDTPAQIFEHAAGALPRRPSSGPAPARIELRPPSCPHRYEFRVRQGIEMLEPEDPSRPGPARTGLWLEGSWTAGPASPLAEGESEATLELAIGELTIGHVQGHRRPGSSEAAGHLASVRLRLGPRGWEEVDGPTALWSAYGTWHGLASFNPGLPERWEPDVPSAWELIVHERGSGLRTEVTRGKTELPEGMSFDDLPEPDASSIEGTVALKGWIELAGTRAAVLVAHAKLDVSDEFEVPDELYEGKSESVEERAREMFEGLGASTKGDYDAHFVVLESGQLLHAALVERQVVTMSMGTGEDMVQRHSEIAEARLVESCAGPVMPAFADSLTPVEQALEHIVTLRNAAADYPGHEPEPERIAALLGPALVEAVPQASACLIEASATYGAAVFGTPELPAFDNYPEAGPDRVIVELQTDLEQGEVWDRRVLDLRAEFVVKGILHGRRVEVPEPAVLRGRVLDGATGKPWAGVAVGVTMPGPVKVATLTTSREGRFRLAGLLPTMMQVSVEKQGYAREQQWLRLFGRYHRRAAPVPAGQRRGRSCVSR